ncbi:hypothetical protein B0H10DRAFT_480773 [Mycena sp. CBHHK59/15]|nr:hypothetical protein B0H10DRAFT_480773 [Mycena sp. CBHHK59/15]
MRLPLSSTWFENLLPEGQRIIARLRERGTGRTHGGFAVEDTSRLNLLRECRICWELDHPATSCDNRKKTASIRAGLANEIPANADAVLMAHQPLQRASGKSYRVVSRRLAYAPALRTTSPSTPTLRIKRSVILGQKASELNQILAVFFELKPHRQLSGLIQTASIRAGLANDIPTNADAVLMVHQTLCKPYAKGKRHTASRGYRWCPRAFEG